MPCHWVLCMARKIYWSMKLDNPLRVDEAYSWQYPLAVHGMMHTVLRNAHSGKHGQIDVLMMFMANMSWNSAMNTHETLHWLTDKDAQGDPTKFPTLFTQTPTRVRCAPMPI